MQRDMTGADKFSKNSHLEILAPERWQEVWATLRIQQNLSCPGNVTPFICALLIYYVVLVKGMSYLYTFA
jgi:hypothetical protein